MPFDPVARFHLGNGALVHAVHADADTSENGRAQSNGTMVNYLYDLKQISQNHEQFVGDKTVVASDAIKALSASIPAQAKEPEDDPILSLTHSLDNIRASRHPYFSLQIIASSQMTLFCSSPHNMRTFWFRWALRRVTAWLFRSRNLHGRWRSMRPVCRLVLSSCH